LSISTTCILCMSNLGYVIILCMKFYLIFLLFLISPVSAADRVSIVGSEGTYIVRDGDSLSLISSRLGTNVNTIVSKNHIDANNPIHRGQELTVNTRKIVPQTLDNGILINIPDRMLYFFHDGKLELYFPVGLGRPPSKGSRNWSTPLGTFVVLRKEKNPTWYVPESIRKEMEAQGKPVHPIVPPGPENPLGRYAIRISMPWVLIHETIAPTSVYTFRSHGCIRVMPEHIERFFEKVEINTPGELIYKPVKAAVSDQGRIFLEVHKDIYGKIKDLKGEALKVIGQLGVSGKVNWEKVDSMLREKSGIAEDITL
jgi:L,D-transpeptidase ErfK/SrfK